MAILKSTSGTSSVSILYRDLDSDNTVENNINSGAANIQQIFINNTNNTSTPFYLHMWNATSATPGTTKPAAVLYCPANTSKHYVFPKNFVFGTGVCIAGTNNIAAVSYTPTSPANNVIVQIYISA
tara:strand:+ start:907 stop:1284 length:378 start_codon:yes stop_codon:yes gene_type:complete